MNYANELTTLLHSQIKIPAELITIETPPDQSMGNYALPCFKLAKQFRKSPQAVAQEIAGEISNAKPDWLSKAEASGPYVNFFLERGMFAQTVINEILSTGKDYGKSNEGAGKKVLVEFSSPNIAKYFHVGHLGSTVIGRALSNILEHLGYGVVRMNYLGDWGTQFGKMITAYLKWGNREEIEKSGVDGLVKLYVKFHDEAEKDETLNGEARSWVVKMQNGDEEGLRLWRWFIDLSVREYERIYETLGVKFDVTLSESMYNGKMEAVAEELEAKGLLKESNGAKIVDLEESGMPPCLILRSDGGTLYPTRDIASAMERHKEYGFYKSLYVTGMEQMLHFAQWMKVVELMGYPWAKDMEHIPYGLYILPEGKISTRHGKVIKMDDLLDEAISKTMDIIKEKNPDLPGKEEVAKQVGIGAVIFSKLFNSRMKDVLFSWEKMLNFEGETGPYVQYTHARACSVLEKANARYTGSAAAGIGGGTESAAADFNGGTLAGSEFNGGLLSDGESFAVLKLLYDYPARVSEAAEKYEPFVITRLLIEISQSFNAFYHNHVVLVDDAETRNARLALTAAVRNVLANGLTLLGIAAPQRM